MFWNSTLLLQASHSNTYYVAVDFTLMSLYKMVVATRTTVLYNNNICKRLFLCFSTSFSQFTSTWAMCSKLSFFIRSYSLRVTGYCTQIIERSSFFILVRIVSFLKCDENLLAATARFDRVRDAIYIQLPTNFLSEPCCWVTRAATSVLCPMDDCTFGRPTTDSFFLVVFASSFYINIANAINSVPRRFHVKSILRIRFGLDKYLIRNLLSMSLFISSMRFFYFSNVNDWSR